jgi:hypothetical protein
VSYRPPSAPGLGLLIGVAGGVLLGLAVLADPAPPAGGQLPRRPDRSPYADAVLADRPVAYWRLGEGPGATAAADASGHGHHGRYHGQPRLGQPGALAGDADTALGLGGPRARSYVEVPAREAFGVAASGEGLSVEVWLRPDALTFAGEQGKDPKNPYIHWLGKGEAGAQEWGFRFYTDAAADRPNRISAYVWNADGGEGAGAYVEDRLTRHRWVHLVATYDDPGRPDAQVRIYRDGVASPHNGGPGTLYRSYHVKPAAGPAPVRLGTRDLGSFLTGGLDEVAVYPYVLTPERVREHWRLGSGAAHPGGR